MFTIYNIHSGSIPWKIPDFLSDGKCIVMFDLALTIYEIFANQEKCENFELETEGQGQEVEERGLRYLIGHVRIHIGEFFQNFSYLETIQLSGSYSRKLITHACTYARERAHMHTNTHTRAHARAHTHTHTHTQKQSHLHLMMHCIIKFDLMIASSDFRQICNALQICLKNEKHFIQKIKLNFIASEPLLRFLFLQPLCTLVPSFLRPAALNKVQSTRPTYQRPIL